MLVGASNTVCDVCSLARSDARAGFPSRSGRVPWSRTSRLHGGQRATHVRARAAPQRQKPMDRPTLV